MEMENKMNCLCLKLCVRYAIGIDLVIIYINTNILLFHLVLKYWTMRKIVIPSVHLNFLSHFAQQNFLI